MTSSGRDMATPPSPTSAMASGKYSMLTVSPLRTTAVLIGLDRATPPGPAFALADGFRNILVTSFGVTGTISSLDTACAGASEAATVVFLSQLGPPTLGVFGCCCSGLADCRRLGGSATTAGAAEAVTSGRASTTVTLPLFMLTATAPDLGNGTAVSLTASPVPVAPAPGQTPNVGTNAQYGSRYLRIQ